jgi:hypothetical protein
MAVEILQPGRLAKLYELVVEKPSWMLSSLSTSSITLILYGDDTFYLFLQKQQIALKPYTPPPGYFTLRSKCWIKASVPMGTPRPWCGEVQ